MSDSFSRYDVYTTVQSKYCYGGTGVLKNRFDIREPAELKAVESDIFAVRQKQLLKKPLKGTFSPTHLCRLHRYLFGDVYSFAGRYRTEDISKGKTLFLHYAKIGDELAALLHELKTEKILAGLDYAVQMQRISYYFAALNYIHPFREGNGRTCREFIRLIMEQLGYFVDWGKIDHDEFILRMEDSVYDERVLIPVFETITIPISK